MGNAGSNDSVRIVSSPAEAKVPEYEVFLRTEARHPYVVYILAFNERQPLAQQLDRFPKDSERGFDIMLGDDGSTDGTGGLYSLEQYAIRGATRLKHNSGLSQNIKVALQWLYGQNYKGVILMNGNNRDDYPDRAGIHSGARRRLWLRSGLTVSCRRETREYPMDSSLGHPTPARAAVLLGELEVDDGHDQWLPGLFDGLSA